MSGSGKYRTEVVGVEIGGRTYEIERVSDIDTLLDDITPEEFGVDERLPYWAQLWASSIALSRYIVEKEIAGDTLIELGAGLGLTSIAAAKSFRSVTCTDYESDALEFARRNSERNPGTEGRIEFRLLDWRKREIEGRFDVVAASDVLYEKRNTEPVLRFVERCTGRYALVADPFRSTADEFLERAGTKFEVEIEKYQIVLDDVKTGVRVCRLTPRRRSPGRA